MSRERAVILGAGLAGLSAGRALAEAGADYVILEGGSRPGGLCRTETAGGFTFDYTGHLLHLKEGRSRDLILGLVGKQLQEHTRRASIYVKNTFVPYPIQAHFGALPEALAQGCLEDLVNVAGGDPPSGTAFPAWARGQFGDTLARIFMIPYNRKLYVHPLEEMEPSWTSWSVPRPTVQEITAAAAGGKIPVYGYNATFLYPRRGGIDILPAALAAGQEGCLRTGSEVVDVDTSGRRVRMKNGEDISYHTLISTMPLPDFLRISGPLPDRAAGFADRLRHSSVLGVCIGLDGPVLRDDHWIYFPDGDVPFYRIGFPSNFSRGVAPPGCGSLYAEAAFGPGSPPDPNAVAKAAMGSLRDLGIIDPSTGVRTRLNLTIPCAYVFHDRFRAQGLDPLLASLRETGIISVGRYGAWEYSGMQEAVDWGLNAARETLS